MEISTIFVGKYFTLAFWGLLGMELTVIFMVFNIWLHLFIFFNIIASRFDFIPFSIRHEDSNPRPLSCKSSPFTTGTRVFAK